MSFCRTALAVVLTAASLARAQDAGSMLTPPSLDGFTQIGATSVADLAGRAVLYEFFAYW